MNRGRFFFITGGARSGKSAYAEQLASALKGQVTYIATAEPLDDEMERRIALHRRRRPADWQTVEEPLEVAAAVERIGSRPGVILVDCLTLLISNWLFGAGAPQDVAAAVERAGAQVEALAEAARNAVADVIIVSNEVGLGLVPSYPQGRLFRDVAGRANQLLAASADRVILVVAGKALDLTALNLKIDDLLETAVAE